MDHQRKAWQMIPNRKIMPTRYVVMDPRQNIAMQFDQKILGKMVNTPNKADSADANKNRFITPTLDKYSSFMLDYFFIFDLEKD